MSTRLPPPPFVAPRARGRHLLPVFLRPRALLRFFRDKRASRLSKVMLAAALLYLVVPIDFIPDVAPLIGWLDDAGFIAAAIGLVLNRVAAYEAAEPAREVDPVLRHP